MTETLKIDSYFQPNSIYCGDCEKVLSKFPDNCVDLIYADPPFFTNEYYEVIWKDSTEKRAFEDRWKGGIEHYISWMEPKLRECQRVLKSTGSIYLHCDDHANAHLRILMDKIFGEKNFQNTVIWHYGLGGSSPRRWASKHDTILFYTKTNEWKFTPFMTPATSQMMKGQQKKMDDVWDIPTINNMAKERLGYPTQKPEVLLERIINASSDKENVVLDPFCGCGTAICVAQKLKRKWIGIDVSPTACDLMETRMRKLGVAPNMMDMPTTEEVLHKLSDWEFQNWVVKKLHGRTNNKKTGDMGIDGFTFEWNPIQVKQSESIGRVDIDKFETAIRRSKKTKGIIVAFSFGKGAYEEIARAKNQENLEITALTIKEILP